MSKVYFTSDTHFGHSNLIKNFRGFESSDEHNQWLIDDWNSVVKKRDLVIHLGDVSLDHKILVDIMPKLNGTKKLVIGNHDSGPIKFYLKYFSKIYGVWNYNGYLLSHMPIHPQELQFRVKKNIHGHIHHMDRLLDPKVYFNACVDIIFKKFGKVVIPFDYIRDNF